jgi:hypothetical protein
MGNIFFILTGNWKVLFILFCMIGMLLLITFNFKKELNLGLSWGQAENVWGLNRFYIDTNALFLIT